MTTVHCPICRSGRSSPYASIDDCAYFCCAQCGSIHIDPSVIDMLDAGGSLVGDYTEEYWEQERVGAIERAAGVSLCRAGEAILYCRRPVQRFLDLGAGPGFLLQELHRLIDPPAAIFHGVEKYPPPYAASCPNFHIGGIEVLQGRFDAGVCIEVIEHLTPRMLDKMLSDLAGASEPGSLWLFNTGMPDYVRTEDPRISIQGIAATSSVIRSPAWRRISKRTGSASARCRGVRSDSSSNTSHPKIQRSMPGCTTRSRKTWPWCSATACCTRPRSKRRVRITTSPNT